MKLDKARINELLALMTLAINDIEDQTDEATADHLRRYNRELKRLINDSL